MTEKHKNITVPELKFFGRVTAEVSQPIEVGQTSEGRRRIIPITGGKFLGNLIDGKILPGGADFQVVTSPTVTELEAKYAIELTDGERIYIDNFGLRTACEEDIAKLVAGHPVPPERVYFRCSPKLTGTGSWAWVSERIFIGTARRHPEVVEIDIFEVM